MRWAERELTTLSPLNLEGLEIKVDIQNKLIEGLPLEMVEEDVKALHKILQTLREERQAINGKRVAATLLLGLPENQEHLQLLQQWPLPDSLRSLLIAQFTQGEYYGQSQ